jgi:hypothetical protein
MCLIIAIFELFTVIAIFELKAIVINFEALISGSSFE